LKKSVQKRTESDKR